MYLKTIQCVCVLVAAMCYSSAWADETTQATEQAKAGAEVAASQAPEANANADAGTDASATSTSSFSAMDTVIITATGFDTRQFEAPYATEVVGSKQLHERQYRTVPQALRDIPGVMIQETALGHGSPYIRGFTSFRNLFMIDGIRLNNSAFRPGPNQYWNTVDAQMIDSIEVVKGPSSVLFGSDAIGGTVNARTINPYAYGSEHGVAGRAAYRFSTAENSHAVRGEISGAYEDTFGVVAGGTYRNFADLQGGSDTGEQPGTGYAEWHNDIKLEYFVGDNARVIFASQMTRQNNVPRTHKTVDAVSFEGTTVGSDLKRELDQERQLTYIQFLATDIEGPVRELHASFSWHQQNEVRDRVRSNGNAEFQGFEVDTLGLFIHAKSETSIGDLVYGVDYYRDWVSSFSSRNAIQGPIADDATYDLLGIFVQNTIPVTSFFDLTVGGRITYAAVDAGKVDVNDVSRSIQESWWNFAGNARAAIYIDEQRHWNIFGGVSQGFRAPNLSDLTRDSDFGGGVEQPSPGLDPENYIMFETGVKTSYSNVAAQVSVFHYLIDDQIIRVPTGPGSLFNKVNAEDGFLQGIEAGGSWQALPELEIFGNATYMDGEVASFQSDGTAFDDYPSRLMPLTGQIGARYEPNNLPFWVEGIIRGAAEADRLSLRDISDTERIPPGGTPGYIVGSVRAAWELCESTTITVGVENITNEDYRIHGSGQNMPGINFVFGFETRF